MKKWLAFGYSLLAMVVSFFLRWDSISMYVDALSMSVTWALFVPLLLLSAPMTVRTSGWKTTFYVIEFAGLAYRLIDDLFYPTWWSLACDVLVISLIVLQYLKECTTSLRRLSRRTMLLIDVLILTIILILSVLYGFQMYFLIDAPLVFLLAFGFFLRHLLQPSTPPQAEPAIGTSTTASTGDLQGAPHVNRNGRKSNPKRWKGIFTGIAAFLYMLSFATFVAFFAAGEPGGFWFFLLIAGVASLILGIGSRTAWEQYQEFADPYVAEARKAYVALHEEYGMTPSKERSVGNGFQAVTNGSHLLILQTAEYWEREMRTVCGRFYREAMERKPFDSTHLHPFHIRIDDLFFFGIDGEIRYETKVTGGGYSVGKAIVGGIVAGGVGAIVAGKKKTESETVKIDERKTILKYYQDGQLLTQEYAGADMHARLEQILPMKDAKIVLNTLKETPSNQPSIKPIVSQAEMAPSSNRGSVEKRMDELRGLYDKGYLSEAEYNAKKAEILKDL